MPSRTDNSPPQNNQPTVQTHRDIFGAIAAVTTRLAGSKWAFLIAVLSIFIWGAFGPYLNYSDHWQIVINTGTTIVTFLMVFLIQNAQNRESKAVHLKLDELIYAVNRANNQLILAESLSEEELDKLGDRYRRLGLAAETRESLKRRVHEVGQEVEAIGQEVEGVQTRVAQVEKKAEKNLSK
jgi:low affinity Fe/Cu permease